MSLHDREHEPHLFLVPTLLFAAIVITATVDLVLDSPDHWIDPHVWIELLLIGLSLFATVYLVRGWRRALRAINRLEQQLEERQVERDAWQATAERQLHGLSDAIDRQLRAWGLTDAERETALMLLRGYSHKLIARRTNRSERTVRQHAVAVYRKSGLAGRAELAAFFLEGLPLPSASSG